MKSVSTNFRFKSEFHRRIKQAAAAHGTTLAAWVVAACLDKLDERNGKRLPITQRTPGRKPWS
jgi:HicB family